MGKDWCAEVEKLQTIYETVRDGEQVTESRFGEDFIKYRNADLNRIEKDRDYARAQCEIQKGKLKRRRFAARVRA
ncbi:hypothetical protein SAMN04488518_113117 [Pseudovibrio ascidiaceicola]|uniref:Phage protein n=2 Tax=Pseudovibrio ascidiaceicola TaxID=285279 RepID=A0A1I4E0Q0_9HYPH|nr:hypothetical protein SAMN04488518_113117 [Pseudovibrio ascidiaceicola]